MEGTIIKAICAYCGKEYERSKGSRYDKKYCSDECCNTARRIQYQKERKNRICKQCGEPFIYTSKTGHSWFCSDECANRWRYEHGSLKKAIEDANRRCAEWIQNGVPENFTVLSDWKEGDGNVEIEIRCNDCGGTFIKPIYFARRTVHCPLCYEKIDSHYHKYGSMDDYNAVRDLKHQELVKRKEEEKEARKKKKICKVCGAEFEAYQASRVCCSSECSRKYEAEQKRARMRNKDDRLNESNIVDKDITLKRLYKRDNGICWICGEKCDYSDFSTGENGMKKCGDKYPSVDHVIPLSRGGLHAWKNVALAHLKCNIIKSDNIPDLGIEFDYPEKRGRVRESLRKTVFQYDFDGTLIGKYESTAEAERKTGLKQRGIQDCARGESKTYRGFIWRYKEKENERTELEQQRDKRLMAKQNAS